MLRNRPLSLVLILLASIVLLAVSVQAQDAVTYDEVNAVAARMFCPECENIPLDKCFTEVCVQWKQDIADQIAAGRAPDAIVDDFVARFGDQVIGVPQDPLLRTLTLAVPWLLAAGFAVFAFTTYTRLRAQQAPAAASRHPDPALDAYRQRIERDLNE